MSEEGMTELVLADGFGYGTIEEPQQLEHHQQQQRQQEPSATVRVRFPWGVIAVPRHSVRTKVDVEVLHFEPNANDFTVTVVQNLSLNTPISDIIGFMAVKLSVHQEYVRLAHKGVELRDANATLADVGVFDPPQLLCVLQREPHLIAAKLIQEFVENLHADAFIERWERKERAAVMKQLATVTTAKDLANVLFMVEKCLHRRVLVEMWEFFRKTWVSILGNITSVRAVVAWVWFFLQFVKSSAIGDSWLEEEEWQERTVKFIIEDCQGQFVCVQLCLLHVQAHIRSHCFSEDWADWEWRLQWLTDALNVKFGDTTALSYLFSVLGNNIQHRYLKESDDGVPVADWIQGWVASLDAVAKNVADKFRMQSYAEHLMSLTDRLDESALDEEWTSTWSSWRYVLELISANPQELILAPAEPRGILPPLRAPRQSSNGRPKLKRESTISVQFEDAVQILDGKLERIEEGFADVESLKEGELVFSLDNFVVDEGVNGISSRLDNEGDPFGDKEDVLDFQIDGPIPAPVLKRSST
eukprot:TRINITY_DN3337_c0_g1_i1.p1 TRINITY_DN3337_c0_g1~~TRINITY_DN3337_c0_g1_i1.p1  ORF type:complete len:549 (+),score=144.26 TRINITY_DN3337_c0_g1_i1:61-1647(+)